MTRALKLSANLGFLWQELPLLERIERAAHWGFPAVELHWPYDVPPEQIAAACRRNRVELMGLNTPLGDRPGDFGLAAAVGREAEFRAGFLQALDYCRLAGAQSIHVMAGVANNDDKQSVLGTFKSNLDWALAMARDTGTTLLLEPINTYDKPGYALDRVEVADQLLTLVDDANVKIMFDCYHVARMGGDVLVLMAKYIDRIGHIQVAAVPDRGEPDGGDLDYQAVFDLIGRLDYAGYVGCEYKPRAATDTGFSWLRDLRISKP